MEGAARGDYRKEVSEREVRQRTNKESWRHRCQNVLEPLVEMPREHLAESSQNNKGVSLTRVCPGSRRREGLVWWWKREETSCAYNGRPQRLPDTGFLRRRPWRQRRRHGNWLDRRILVTLLWSLSVSPLYERRRERAKREGWGCWGAPCGHWDRRAGPWRFCGSLATISSEKTRDQTRKREEDGVSCYERRVLISLFRWGHHTTLGSCAHWSEDRSLRRADSVVRRMRQRSTCGFGARPS